jgi:hypothetical protein
MIILAKPNKHLDDERPHYDDEEYSYSIFVTSLYFSDAAMHTHP